MSEQAYPLWNFLLEKFPGKHAHLDLLRYEIDARFYYFGDHYNLSVEARRKTGAPLKEQLTEKGISTYVRLKSLQRPHTGRVNVMNSAYFNLGEWLKKEGEGLMSTRPPWNYNTNRGNIFEFHLYKQAKRIIKKLEFGTLQDLLSDEFIEQTAHFESSLEKFVEKHTIKALFIPADAGFFNRLSIRVFKKLRLPTFLFIHGLPGGYNTADNNRVDFLAVWGEQIRENFIAAGIPGEKIVVTGHPMYSVVNEKLRAAHTDVLVISKPLQGTQFGGRYVLRDRSNSICYLMMVQEALLACGVTKARFRVHPSENINWYNENLDRNFYASDMEDMSASLNRSTLVIGPTSTMFVEALLRGVNYCVFEPRLSRGIGFDGNILVAPFDGSEPLVPTASSVTELRNLLIFDRMVDTRVLINYISPAFSLKPIIEIINSRTDRSYKN